MNHNGKKVNGVQMFTIRPIEDAIAHYQWELMENLSRAAAALETENRVAKYNERHPDAPAKVQFMGSAS